MYEAFYGLKEKPFNLLPDPDFLFMSKEHENAYTYLQYAVSENKGFVVVTGEIGSGKTTLINYLLGKIGQEMQVGLINNTYLAPEQLLRMVCREYELNVEGRDKAELMDAFHTFLLEQFARQQRVILFIDEAQNLSPQAMEEVRMLSNMEAEKHHLIQIIMVGQPELRSKLQRKDLEQFSQRVSVYCHLKALENDEVAQYIRHRLKAGGASKLDLFDQEAINEISRCSRGIPRLINSICDTALVYGFADAREVIDLKIIRDVVADREIGNIDSEGTGGAGIENRLADGMDRIPSGLDTTAVKYLEKRMELIENQVSAIESKISNLHGMKGKRDEIIVELLRLLKTSIENRYNTLSRFAALKRNIDQKNQSPARSSEAPSLAKGQALLRQRDPVLQRPQEETPVAQAEKETPKGILWALAGILVFILLVLYVDRRVIPLDALWLRIRNPAVFHFKVP
jgi:general secretion pathway protein A